MLTSLAPRFHVMVLCAFMLGCWDHQVEKEFFEKPLETRVERLRQYPLETQYRIFRYGNDVVHPPLTNLAVPIAERGAAAVPFLVTQLERESDDFSVRDILVIVVQMKRLGTYRLKSDDVLMQSLSDRVKSMKDKEWQAICMKMLDELNHPGEVATFRHTTPRRSTGSANLLERSRV